MELIIIFVFLIAITFVFKKFDTFVYSLAALDIFLRIVHFLKGNLMSAEIYQFINQNFPTSIPSLINKYTNGIFNEVLIWIYVINFIVFEIYIIKKILDR
ncbi:MAG: hypothetical protein WDA12_04475 [Bacilli bacterium]